MSSVSILEIPYFSQGADVLEKDLWKNNFPVTAIHGNRNQQEREEALLAFRSGQNPILVGHF